MPQFVVLEQATPGAAEEAAAELAGGDTTIVHGWQPGPGATVCVGRVESAEDAARAVLAAVGGARLVVNAVAPREVVDQLCDDLRRIGELDHRVGPPSGPALSREERALLALLLSGAALGEAARALHISRRTADRPHHRRGAAPRRPAGHRAALRVRCLALAR